MINFYLAHPERKTSSVIARFTAWGKRYTIPCGESVTCAKWMKKKQRCKTSQGDFESELINEQLDKWEEAIKKAVYHYKDADHIPTSEEILKRAEFEKRGGKDLKTIVSIVDYIPIYKERFKASRSKGRMKHYDLLASRLELFQAYKKRTFYFEDLDINFYQQFKDWAYNKQGYSNNYFGALVSILKAVAAEARDTDHLHNNNLKGFHVPKEDVQSIYLTEEELLEFHRLELTETTVREHFPRLDDRMLSQKVEALNKARDLFLLGAFTGLRYSDFSRLDEYHFGENITITAHKSKVLAVIPIHWVVKEILDKGYDFSRKMSEQRLNDHLKELAKILKLNETISVTKMIAGKQVVEHIAKWKLVSTHTARRSFATNAYKSGIPPIAIMKITGHKRESTFMKYIRINEAENAEMMKQYDFFKNP